MKIGYPCINNTLECRGNKTFRLKSYSDERIKKTIENNLTCLLDVLNYNIQNQILFFRITSDLIPFASHPICKYPWQDKFLKNFKKIGKFIRHHNIRITMHPDQFIVLNAKDKDIVKRSIKELKYHAEVMDLLNLDTTAKIQLHIGGVYGDKKSSMKRFVDNYLKLPEKIKKRLVIENDHQRYNINDCLMIAEEISIPIIFDYFHHQIYKNNEDINQTLIDYTKTWSKNDGLPICDYSSQRLNHQIGSHANTIDLADFQHFIELTKPYNIDIMLEIKDKEHSALKAISVVKDDIRFEEKN